MRFLLDTNVASEIRKPRANDQVRLWYESIPDQDLSVSVLLLGEVRRGIERLRRRDVRQALVYEAWLIGLRERYSDRILPVTAEIAEEWARLSVPHPLPIVDGLMVATAKVHGLTFVTRDTAGLERTEVPLLNPWLQP